MKLLLRYGADPEAQTGDKKKAIDLASDPLVVKAILNATSSRQNREGCEATNTEASEGSAQPNTSVAPSSLSSLSSPGTPHVPIGGLNVVKLALFCY